MDPYYEEDYGGYYQKQPKYQNQGGYGQREVTVLMIAEKPSIAKAISSILSNRSASSRKGKSKFLPIYEYHGKFKNMNAFFK
jgi:hypothetical protein